LGPPTGSTESQVHTTKGAPLLPTPQFGRNVPPLPIEGAIHMRFIVLSATIAALAFASAADAKSCKDAKGHFVKCPEPAAAPATPGAKTLPARDAKGHFIKGAAATPAPAPAKPSFFSRPAAPPARTLATHTPMARTGVPNCKTGVPCGKSCIPRGKVCHKN